MPIIKKLLLTAALLAQAGTANAQDSDQNDGCSTAQGAPVIERIDVATLERPTATSAVVRLDVVAAQGDGQSLSYAFSGSAGAIASEGAQATWNVEGEGPFTASIEVSGPGNACVSYASVTFTPDAPGEASEPDEPTE